MKFIRFLSLVWLLYATSTANNLVYADGKSDYDTKCSACHGFGIAGAPKLSDFDNWQIRLQKGLDVLYENAIKGFNGESGVMPAKGGFVNLSEDQVRAVVDYMIQQSQM